MFPQVQEGFEAVLNISYEAPTEYATTYEEFREQIASEKEEKRRQKEERKRQREQKIQAMKEVEARKAAKTVPKKKKI